MSANQSTATRWTTVALFAMAMAWVESAVVFYLRTMVDRIEPYQANPLPLIGRLGPVELARELATLIMLLTVGALAGRKWSSRIGYMAIGFGVWDIFYYVFLKAMCGWPHSLMDWDILFLLPLPWWGPVLAPISISLLMIAWGSLTVWLEGKPSSALRMSSIASWGTAVIGMGIALYAFMADCLRVADQGTGVIRNVLPEQFLWLPFGFGFVLMTAPVVEITWRNWLSRAGVFALERPGLAGKEQP